MLLMVVHFVGFLRGKQSRLYSSNLHVDFNAKDIKNVVTGRQYFLSQPDHDMNVTDGSSFCWLSLRQTKSGFILPKCFKAEA